MEFADWWFSIRPSNTEPWLRLLIEAKNEKILAAKRAAIEAVLITASERGAVSQ
jgi:phosphomannomutase